jgi:hypothetical protein
MPAVYAFPLLPFVFPGGQVAAMLPIGALIASVFFFASLLAYKKCEMKRNGKVMQVSNDTNVPT